VPFRKKDKVFKHYREVCDKLYDGFHATAGQRHLENFKRNVAEKGVNDLVRERQRLQRDIETKKSEIQNYETNLTFFTSKSKSGNSLVEDILKKIERLKEDLTLLADKLATVNERIKAEK
jgi:chromosome segregation ATPase